MLAAPGSGKTRVICHRIRYLIQRGVPPGKICVITFTKNAAGHLRQQLLSFPGSSDGEVLPGFMGTIHGLCFFILTQAWQHRPDILSEKKKKAVIKALLYKKYPNKQIDEEVVESAFSSPIGEEIREDYEREKARLGVLDYDDLIKKTVTLLQQRETERRHWQRVFSCCMVDEFQDLSLPQLELLTLLAGERGNIMAVGDDDQAIYGFRGSMPGIFREFEARFPECRKVVLHTNYRSKEEILQVAGRLISHNKNRYAKDMAGAAGRGGEVLLGQYQNEKEEQLAVLGRIRQALLTLPPGETIGVLFRKNYQLEEFRKAAEDQGLFFSDEGIESGKAFREIKGFIRLMVELQTKKAVQLQSILDVLHCIPGGIARCFLPPGKFSLESWKNFTKGCDETEYEKVCRLEKDLKTMEALGPLLGMKYLFYTMGFASYGDEKWGKGRKEKMLSFVLSVAENIDNWQEFEKKMEEKAVEKTTDRGGKLPVRFMTVHGAKGLEFHTVFLPDLREEVIPGKNKIEEDDIEEERRVLYVAMTRAKIKLYLSYSGDKPCRFIKETLP